LKQKIAEIKKLRSENMAMVREALRDRQPVEGSTPKWLGDLDEAQAMANTVGKPLVVFWSGKFCVPCQEFEDQILEWEEIRDHTLRGAILVKVLVDTDGNDKRASNWGVTKTPALSVSNGNQNVLYEFEPEHSAEFVNTWLSRSLDWARGAPLDEVNPITPIVNYGQPVYGSAGGYATSYGSAGGQAAYGPAQGSAGGYGAAYAQPAYATGSGSAGGYGAYAAPQPTYYARPVFATRAAYYQQPAYAQPAYSQPSYSGGWGNGGGSVVCGPGGCFVQ
jgi:thiol-disulfide isomerase/thioredoxin